MKPVECSETIAYLAEAFYREARGLPPFGSSFIRAKARSLAKNMLKTGGHEVSTQEASSLFVSAKGEPHPKPPFVNFDGF